MNKFYTPLEQSKKLAEILPLESADGYWFKGFPAQPYMVYTKGTPNPGEHIPCWSLAALLDNIPQVKLDSIKQYDKKYWRCCAYFASDWHNSDWCDNPVDACYKMICWLKENEKI